METVVDREKFQVLHKNKSTTNNDLKLPLLMKWLAANGANIDLLSLEEYAPQVRGVHVKNLVENKQQLMTIPLDCLITVEMGKDTSTGQKIQHLKFAAPKHIYLMLFLLLDREKV